MKRPRSRQNIPFMAGSRVFLIGNHPWAGHAGELVAFEELKALHEFAWRVRLDIGQECYANSFDLKTA